MPELERVAFFCNRERERVATRGLKQNQDEEKKTSDEAKFRQQY